MDMKDDDVLTIAVNSSAEARSRAREFISLTVPAMRAEGKTDEQIILFMAQYAMQYEIIMELLQEKIADLHRQVCFMPVV